MTQKVYIVTSGTYSGYQIHAVFSTRAKAKVYINILKEGEIESYDVDVPAEEAFVTTVCMTKKRKIT